MSSSKSFSPSDFTAQLKNSALFSSKFSTKLASATTIAISLLIFFSIIPLASTYIWDEAVIVSVIFVLSGINVWVKNAAIENRQLLLPLFLLAAYSFLQGFATILFPFYSLAFPVSFDPTASIWSGFKILAFALFLGLLLKSAHQFIKFFTWSLIITGNAFAVFGILRYLLQPHFSGAFEHIISSQLTVGTGFGTYFNQNHFALLMLMVFGLNIGLCWFGKLSKINKLLLLAATLISWTALVLTGSRGGIISSFAEIALLIFLPVIQTVKNKKKSGRLSFKSFRELLGRQTAILIITFGLLIAGIIFIGQDRVVERFEDIPQQIGGVTNAGTYRRTDVWQAALLIVKDFPVFGIGFGGFQFAVSQYIDISGQIVPKQAHNDYLELAASGGLVAIALAVWFLIRFFSIVKKRFSESPDNFSGAARAGAICGLSGVALHSFFDFGLQITANLLFFAALLFVAVHRPPLADNSNKEPTAREFPPIFGFAVLILCLILAVSAVIFGAVRYRAVSVKANANSDYAETNLYQIPFDAVYFETKAAAYENAEKFELAANELKKTIEYRPRDYNLWLKLGRIEHLQNRQTEAEIAFRKAIEFAPNYGKPYFFYGDFLVKINRKDEGFSALRTASHRNPQYFEDVISIVWNEMRGNAAEAIKHLHPLDNGEKEKLTIFLLEKGEFQLLTELNCGDKDLTEPKRYGLIHQLLEKNRYYFAERLYKQNCETSDKFESEIEDGNFENKAVEEKTGFGWRVPSFTGNTIVSFEEENAAKGLSLRFNFNGQDNSYALLSQLVVVEKSRRYQLNFSYKTGEIVTGGVPILQIILKKPDSTTSESIAGETKLSLKEKGWVQSVIEFETDKQTEAVEIRLTRQSCPETVCPIFGSLWVDDFYLQKKN